MLLESNKCVTIAFIHEQTINRGNLCRVNVLLRATLVALIVAFVPTASKYIWKPISRGGEVDGIASERSL